MTQDKVLRSRLLQGRLAGEKLVEKYEAVAARPDIAALRWRDSKPVWLNTAYGKLEVLHLYGGFVVRRSYYPLVQAGSPEPVLFPKQRVAKAAGIVHLPDGFGDRPPYRDGLWWDLSTMTSVQTSPQKPLDYPDVCNSKPDDHEWGRKELEELLQKLGANTCVADASSTFAFDRIAQNLDLPPPIWNRRHEGCFQLKTPYGELVVSRFVGWKVERNGAPLVHLYPGAGLVIFDKLEHAKICALRHARGNAADGLTWDVDGTISASKRSAA